MPFTLAQAKWLVANLAVRIPDDFLELKAKAEEFKARHAKILGDSGGKPADWWLRQNFDDVLKRALDSASAKQFDPAFKLLDEAGQLLQQPDTPPPPPPPPPAPAPSAAATPPPPPAPARTPAFNEKDFQKKWAAAKKVWQACVETVDGQLNKVRAKMLASRDPEFAIIADKGLPALTDNHKTPVMKALFELDGLPGDARRNAAVKAGTAIAAFRSHLNSFHLIASLDDHSQAAFGVSLTIRSEIGKGLDALEQAIEPLATG